MSFDKNFNKKFTFKLVSRPLKLIIQLIAAAFVFERISYVLLGSNAFVDILGISRANIEQMHLWTFVSYAFLSTDFLQALLNGLSIAFVGKWIEMVEGPKRLLIVFLIGALGGALGWLALDGFGEIPFVGSTAAMLGLVTYFCCLQGTQPITFPLFLLFPVSLKPQWIIMGLAGYECLKFFNGRLDSSAHLGGIIATFLYYNIRYYVRLRAKRNHEVSYESPKTTPKQLKFMPKILGINMFGKENLKKEVDRVLDKISQFGFNSLTTQERKLLDKAKDLI